MTQELKAPPLTPDGRTIAFPASRTSALSSHCLKRTLQRDGARIDLDFWFKQWREQARIYQTESKRYWLYN